MKCQILFFLRKIRKTNQFVASEFAHSMVCVNVGIFTINMSTAAPILRSMDTPRGETTLSKSF